ncbi:MAG: acyl-CoA dehydrogenase family protein [Chloroflexota bacterium]|nr:acyl-CoA dehydrogenase family protein [Chloroflexota bacterium]
MDFAIPEELNMLQKSVRRFVKEELMPLEREILGREGDPTTGRVALPAEEENRLSDMVRDMELWGLGVPEELGGVGLPALGLCLVEEELAKTVIPFNFGDVSPILFDCNEAQKSKYLQPVIDGEKRACLAILEDTGAEPISMKTTAVRYDGYYVITGQKICMAHVTDAGDFAVVFAVTDKEKGRNGGVTCFLVDRGTPGFTSTGGGERVGRHAQVVQPLYMNFDNCRVSVEDILGEEGQAFYLGMKWLPARRVVRAARCVGAAERLLDVSKEYAKAWESFGQLMRERPGVQRALADMSIELQAARLLVYHAAWKLDEGEDVLQEAAMVKVYATEMVERVADRAIQIHGGPLYTKNLPLERLCRNAIAANTTEQALDLQRMVIARDLLKY